VTIWIFALGLLVRLPVLLFGASHVPPTADGRFYHVVAQRIAEGHGYTWLWPDGAVTYAAHYPVGYPAMVGLGYAVFGAQPWVAMALGAILGALGAAALVEPCRRSVLSSPWPEHANRAAVITGLWLAVSPSLVAYVPAMMTEVPVAALGALCLRSCLWVRDRPSVGRWLLLAALAGLSVLFRPQMLLLSPLWGILASAGSWRKRTLAGVLVLMASLLVVLPWTLRNCAKMERCVLVSANGGWNLLIGTFPEGRGAWVGVDGARVPEECRSVFQEAEKDSCFGRAGVRRITASPLPWLSLLPAKWRATFDYTGAAASYLHEAGVLSERGRLVLGGVEIVSQRLGYLVGLFGVAGLLRARHPGRRRLAVASAVVLGAAGLLGAGAWFGLAVLMALAFLSFRSELDASLLLPPLAILATALVHGVFFGAGRYSLPLVLWTAPLVALGLALGLASCEVLTARKISGDNR
jgi:4-amino-4-deoxy-L-arabinose transferase-like glycosyltransferase